MKTFRTLNYQYNPIYFNWVNGHLMANAHSLAKPFNKRPEEIFKTKSWQEFKKALCNDIEANPEEVQFTVQGKRGDTWIHQELVYEFARRMKPKFALWINRRIRQLLGGNQINTQHNENNAFPQTLSEALQMAAELAKENEKLKREVNANSIQQLSYTLEVEPKNNSSNTKQLEVNFEYQKVIDELVEQRDQGKWWMND